ncbi:MAG: hypothetical protein II754_02965 [Lachnospiraceae bacterium]|nr:hypothetical protein [Lachnospiraceae bacterium]
MGLYDVLDEIAEKQILKTETGDNRIFGIVVGEVVNHYNTQDASKMAGRICVKIHTRDEEKNVLKWARVAMPYSGSKWGFYFLPEIGDQVLIAFEQGNIERPYVIGCIPKDADDFLKKSAEETNQHKVIKSKNGSVIQIEDVKPGEGESGSKDSITIHTPEKQHLFQLDDDKKKMLLEDKDKNISVEMKTEKGDMKIKVANSFVLEVGDKVKITISKQGKISIEAADYNNQLTGKYTTQANGNVTIEGAGANFKGTNMATLESGSVLTLKSKVQKSE